MEMLGWSLDGALDPWSCYKYKLFIYYDTTQKLVKAKHEFGPKFQPPLLVIAISIKLIIQSKVANSHVQCLVKKSTYL